MMCQFFESINTLFHHVLLFQQKCEPSSSVFMYRLYTKSKKLDLEDTRHILIEKTRKNVGKVKRTLNLPSPALPVLLQSRFFFLLLVTFIQMHKMRRRKWIPQNDYIFETSVTCSHVQYILKGQTVLLQYCSLLGNAHSRQTIFFSSSYAF